MSRFYHFREFVFPICELLAGKEAGSFSIAHFLGTGFGIGTEGFFLSAHHVVNAESLAMCSPGSLIGALVTEGEWRHWKVNRILSVERYQDKDVVLGRLESELPPFFSSKNQDLYGWEDVHLFGYPDSLKTNTTTGQFMFTGQFLKGYITRRLDMVDGLVPGLVPAYELNFPIPLGISGSPVFRTGPDHSLVGVALASVDMAMSMYEHTEIQDSGGTYSEKVKKVEQFGIAARIYELAEWKPVLAKGKRLNDLY